MDKKNSLLSFFRGTLFIFALTITAMEGVVIMAPMLLVLPFSWFIYRSVCDFIANKWFTSVSFFLEVNGTKMIFAGEDFKNINKGEPTIIISNHPTQFDWLLLWPLLLRYGNLSHEKIILKNSLKNFPLFGWGMQHFCFLFIRRSWEKDEVYLKYCLEHFSKKNYPLQLLIFPEGTNLIDSNKQKSKEFAINNNLTIYEHVLHPRIKGFQHSVKLLKHIKCIYDITIGFPDLIPTNEIFLLQGQFPREVHFYLKRYELTSIPKTEEGIGEWCKQRWAEKELLLKEFYKRNKFPQTLEESAIPCVRYQYIETLSFWIILGIIMFYLTFTTSFGIWFVMMCFIIELFVSLFLGGMDSLEKKFAPNKKLGL